MNTLREKMSCPSVIWCGPGHQSSYQCERLGPHKVHYCRYMGYELYWRGGLPGEEKAFTGYMDESPLEEGDTCVSGEDEV